MSGLAIRTLGSIGGKKVKMERRGLMEKEKTEEEWLERESRSKQTNWIY